MALKPPPPPWEVLQQVGELIAGPGLKGEVDRSVRAVIQSALTRLDVVSREEFDAQAELLKRTEQQVAELEAQLEELTREVEDLAGGR